MWHETTAIATAIYAGASVLLLLGVVAGFLQLSALRRNQQLQFLESCMDEYRSSAMNSHLNVFRNWARRHSENVPLAYCVLRASRDQLRFLELHDHRRHVSQFFQKLARAVDAKLIPKEFVLRHLQLSFTTNCSLLFGIEWRMVRQTRAWDGSQTTAILREWPLVELFIAHFALERPKTYASFERRSWPTPFRWRERRAEARDPSPLLPRWRRFFEALSREEGYSVWARAALNAVDTPLTASELEKPWLYNSTRLADAVRALIDRLV